MPETPVPPLNEGSGTNNNDFDEVPQTFQEIIKMDFHRRLIETIISRQPLDIVDEITRRNSAVRKNESYCSTHLYISWRILDRISIINIFYI